MFQMNCREIGTQEFRRRIYIAGLSAVFAFAAMLPKANSQTAQAPVSPAPSQVVTAEEVSLDVVVHDKKNRLVLDLKPEEIAVTDDGSPMTLKNLRLVSGNADSDRLVTLVFGRPNSSIKLTNDDSLSKSAKAAATSQWSFYNQSIMKTARDTAAKILKMIPESGFSFAVMDVAGRLRVEQGYTSDRKAIVEAVNAATDLSSAARVNGLSEPERELIAMARTGTDASGKALSARDRALAASLTSVVYDSGRIAQDQHLPPSLAGLLALAQAQQKLTQRKVVIYFTFSADMQFDAHADALIPSIVGAANRAGVSLYIVDLDSLDPHGSRQDAADMSKGAMAMSINSTTANSITSNNATSFGTSGGMGGMESAGGLGMMRDIGDDIENNDIVPNSALQNLAKGTGGAYINRDHLRKPLEQMIQDMTTYYEASYVPAIKDYDGSFRPVAVKPLRAGLKIRTQTGYLALPPHAGDGSVPQAFELPLLKILSATPLPADQAFHAAILRMGDSPDGNVNTVAVEAPLSSLEVQPGGQRRHQHQPLFRARVHARSYQRQHGRGIAALQRGYSPARSTERPRRGKVRRRHHPAASFFRASRQICSGSGRS
jgi:VWFA-related protein